jgi:uncharacterized protein (TIGR00661 family)
MARVLISPLNWGLGHATRDIAIMKVLEQEGHEISVAASGAALDLLKKEFPNAAFYNVRDYSSPYTRRGFSISKFIARIPTMVKQIQKEHHIIEQLVSAHLFDLVISDNRFGAYSHKVPSIFISHQLRSNVPKEVELLERMTEMFNEYYHKKYAHVIVADNPPGSLSLTGKLGKANRPVTLQKAYYAGILSSIEKRGGPEDIDCLVSISGPQEQKQGFREPILKQITDIPGKKVVLLGEPGNSMNQHLDADTRVIGYADRKKMTLLMNRSRCIVTRSGYTSVMEIAELDKKYCLFVPTPGQTEQEYLSKLYEEKGWFHSVKQKHLSLAKDLEVARNYTGFPAMPKSHHNARKLYEEVIRQYVA